MVLDLVCYRRHGHNELDDPSYTQPLMYNKIQEHPTVTKIYSDRLIADNVISAEDYLALVNEEQQKHQSELAACESYEPTPADSLANTWQSGVLAGQSSHSGDSDGNLALAVSEDTSVPKETLQMLCQHITSLPDGFSAHPGIAEFLANRLRLVEKGAEIDWSTSEALALASVLQDGAHVRMIGQDTERGTFNQRHAVVYDQDTEDRHCMFKGLNETMHIGNSNLSEAAALGFEYGYSLARPEALVIWEAQFGDFLNSAQPIIDTFLVSYVVLRSSVPAFVSAQPDTVCVQR